MKNDNYKHCSRCNSFTNNYYDSQKYICKTCLIKERKVKYVPKGRKHLRIEKTCKVCGTKENLVKNGFYKDGEQKHLNVCKEHCTRNDEWRLAHRQELNQGQKRAWAKKVDTRKAGVKVLIRKWRIETNDKEKEKWQFVRWLETKETKPYLVFDGFFEEYGDQRLKVIKGRTNDLI